MHENLHYVVNLERELLACSEEAWARFADENDGKDIARCPEGRDILTFIAGEDVRDLTGALIEHMLLFPDREIEIPFRCDSARFIRVCALRVSAIMCSGSVLGVMFTSIIADERSRQYNAGCLQRRIPGGGWPLLKYCSYCSKVQGIVSGSDWIGLDDYYGCGGFDEVVLTQTICQTCESAIRDRLRV